MLNWGKLLMLNCGQLSMLNWGKLSMLNMINMFNMYLCMIDMCKLISNYFSVLVVNAKNLTANIND